MKLPIVSPADLPTEDEILGMIDFMSTQDYNWAQREIIIDGLVELKEYVVRNSQ